MKKLILLSAAGLLAFGADAQQASQSVVRARGDVNARISAAPIGSGKMITQTRYRSNAKVTSTPFYTETFGSGAANGIPTGWSVTAGTGISGTWKWMNRASTAPFTNGVLNSSSKADGWMIYDSDSIGGVQPSVLPLTGALISPSINCSSAPSVMVSFEELFRMFRDSTYLDVSIDGGTNWTTFQVNADAQTNRSTSNPNLVRVNITSVAANQANVKLRFRYFLNVNTGAGGSYSWMIDDLKLSDVDPIELGINNSAMFHYLGGNNPLTNYSLFSAIPSTLVDSVLPITYLTNYGLNSVSNVPLDAKVFYGTPGTQVFANSTTYANIPDYTKGLDSVIDWTGFRPKTVGNYTAAFSVAATGDPFTANDVDSQRFAITDTVYTTFGPTVAGAYYLHRPIADGELSYQQGVRFDIPAGKQDTLTSVSVCFDDGTTANGTVNTVVQIYEMTGSSSALNWTPVATMRTKVLNAGDISTSATNLVYTTYLANTQAAGGVGPFILDGGTYAAIVKTLSAPPNSSVLINCGVPIIDKYNVSGYMGQADSNDNSTIYNFSPVGIATGTAGITALVRVNFGRMATNTPGPGSVGTISGVTIGDAFPNPANNTVSVPVSVTSGANVNVSLSNLMGQVLETQALGNIGAGGRKTAVFNTSALSAGIYLYTVESNGQRVTNRLVVTH